MAFTMKFRKLLAFIILPALCFSHNVNADPLVPAFDNKAHHVMDSRGKCVRTKWVAQHCCDMCAPPPPPPPAIVEKQRTTQYVDLIRQSIYFDINKDNIDVNDQQRMNDVITEISKGGTLQSVKMVGYADRFASSKYNMELSKRRAENVLNYFRTNGYFNNIQVGFGFFGKEKPVTNCPTNVKVAEQIACLQADRRVDIEVEIVRQRVEMVREVIPPAYPRPGTSGVEVYSHPMAPAPNMPMPSVQRSYDAPVAASATPVVQSPMEPVSAPAMQPRLAPPMTASPTNPSQDSMPAQPASPTMYDTNVQVAPNSLDSLRPRY